MAELRERGIYETPDGQRLVAARFRRTTASGFRIMSRIGSNTSYFLFNVFAWTLHGNPDFEVTPRGVVIPLSDRISWRLEDLIDTGASA